MKRLSSILDKEGIKYDKEVVAEVMIKHFPDWRRVLNELQRHSVTGIIDSSVLGGSAGNDVFNELVLALKNKNFIAARKWIGENSDIDSSTLFRHLYDNINDLVKPNFIPHLILHLAEYQFKAAFVANQEINLAACVASIMSDCEFK